MIPGLALAAATAAGAYGAAAAFPNLKVGAVVWAIIFGVLGGNLMTIPSSCSAGLKICEKKVLEAAVVLLGAGLSLSSLSALDPKAAAALFGAMLLVIFLGPLLARQLGLSSSVGFLLGAGSAICGSAAIAAVSPFVTKDKSETALSIGIVNLIGFGSMLLLPMIAVQVGLKTEGAALLLGGALPAVGHAVGAGYAAGAEIGTLAIAVKMGRVLCLVPLVLTCSVWAARKREESASVWSVVPWFVPFFIASVGLRSAGLIPSAALPWISFAGKALLTAAMAAIGFGVNVEAVRKHGPKAFALGAVLLLIQTVVVGLAAVFLS